MFALKIFTMKRQYFRNTNNKMAKYFAILVKCKLFNVGEILHTKIANIGRGTAYICQGFV